MATTQVVALEIQVTETGAIKIQTIAQDLDKLGKTATAGSTGMVKLNDSMAKGTISGREMSQAIGALSEAFGQTSPALATASIHASKFINAMGEASLASKITAGAVVGLGGATAALVAQFMEIEKVNARFAEIQRSVDALDLGGIRTGLAKTTIEMDTLNRETSTWTGTFVVGLRNIYALLPGVPNEIEVASQAIEKLRTGLEQVLPFYEKIETAKHTETMAGLEMSGLQAYTANLLATGQLPRGSEAAYATAVQSLIEKNKQAAETVAFQTRQKEFMEAGTHGTLDIESASIQTRYTNTLAEIDYKARVQLEALSGYTVKLGNEIVNSTGNVMGIELKYVSDVGSAWRGSEELKRTLTQETTAWTLNETDKRLSDVDKWQRESLAKIREKEGYARDSEGLEEQVVSAASARRVQIYQEEAKKVREALLWKVDPFEEAEKLRLQTVTVTERAIRDEQAKGYDDGEQQHQKFIDTWIKSELVRRGFAASSLTDEQAKWTGLYAKIQQAEDNHVKAQQSWLLLQMHDTEDYFDKVGLALQLSTREWRSEDQRILDDIKQLAEAGQRTMSDVYFDAVHGNFKNLLSDVENFGNALLRVGTDEAARATWSWLFGGGNGTSGGGTHASSLAAYDQALLSMGGSALSGAAGGSSGGSGGGGILSPITTVISGIQKLYGLATGAAEGGWSGALDGLLGITKLSNTLTGGNAAVGTFGGLVGGGSIYSGVSAATMAELSGAPIGAAVAESGAAGVALSGLSALAAPLAALAGAAVIGTSIYSELTDESSSDVRSRLTGQVLQFFAANPWIRPTLDADAYNDAAWQAIARGGMDNPYRGIANVMSDDASFMGQIGAGGGMNESQIEAMLVANAPASSWFRAQNPYSQTGDIYPSSGGDYGHAEGALFRTSGRTRMEVGEAGTETVAILRNPRSVDLPAGGGGETGSSADVLAELRGMSNRLEQMVRSLSRIERSKTTWN